MREKSYALLLFFVLAWCSMAHAQGQSREQSKEQSPADDTAQTLGALHARSYNFITHRMEEYPSHNPFEFIILIQSNGQRH